MFVSQTLAQDATQWTLSDTKELPNNNCGIYIGGTGDLTVITASGRTVLFKALPVGTQIPIKLRVLKSTGSTATNVVIYLGQGK